MNSEFCLGHPVQPSQLHIWDGGLETVPKNLLPWDRVIVSIRGTPANCDPNMDWLFRNDKYANKVVKYVTPRYKNTNWCKFIRIKLIF
jgi:hypothetical protein